jgi:hypothetical protein
MPGLVQSPYLPLCRERDKSAEAAVTHQPKVCNASAEGLFETRQPNLHNMLVLAQGVEP